MPDPQGLPPIGQEVPEHLNALPPIGGEVSQEASQQTTANDRESPQNGGGVGRFLSTAWEEGPVMGLVNIVKAAKDPMAALKAAKDNQFALFDRAKAEYAKGNYEDAAVHAFNGLIPLLGPKIDELAERGARGDWSGLLGGATGIGLSGAAPELIKAAPSAVRVPGFGAPANAAERAANAFAESRGIPTDAATATGSKVLRGVQAAADRTIASELAGTAKNFDQAKAAGLERVTGEIADQVSPTPISPEQAGAAIRSGLENKISGHTSTANTAYDALRQIEAKSPITVDFGKARDAMRPLYEQMQRQLPITLRQNSPGWTALQQFMEGPTFRRLSDADADLSVIKSMAREGDPTLRSNGARIASILSKNADAAIQEAVTKAGPDALKALQEGRAATRAKYATADVLGQFADEPVKAFRQATLAKDAGVGRLRALHAQTPDALPQIGRAYLEDLADTATKEGGFGHTDKLWSDWSKLGPQTKQLLFKDPKVIQDLDSLFLFAKRAAENPNPSGTMHHGLIIGQSGQLVVSPVSGVVTQIAGLTLSKLLRSPAGIRALRDGFTLPLTHPLASKALRYITQAQAQTFGQGLGPAVAQVAADDQRTTP